MEFKDKKIARSVAEMLNAQPIGGKKGSRWRDDIWTMKYLPKFKWNMLTEQVGEFAFSLFCYLPDSLTPFRIQLMKPLFTRLSCAWNFLSRGLNNKSI